MLLKWPCALLGSWKNVNIKTSGLIITLTGDEQFSGKYKLTTSSFLNCGSRKSLKKRNVFEIGNVIEPVNQSLITLIFCASSHEERENKLKFFAKIIRQYLDNLREVFETQKIVFCIAKYLQISDLMSLINVNHFFYDLLMSDSLICRNIWLERAVYEYNLPKHYFFDRYDNFHANYFRKYCFKLYYLLQYSSSQTFRTLRYIKEQSKMIDSISYYICRGCCLSYDELELHDCESMNGILNINVNKSKEYFPDNFETPILIDNIKGHIISDSNTKEMYDSLRIITEVYSASYYLSDFRSSFAVLIIIPIDITNDIDNLKVHHGSSSGLFNEWAIQKLYPWLDNIIKFTMTSGFKQTPIILIGKGIEDCITPTGDDSITIEPDWIMENILPRYPHIITYIEISNFTEEDKLMIRDVIILATFQRNSMKEPSRFISSPQCNHQ